MTVIEFNVKTAEVGGNAFIVTVSGEADLHTAPELDPIRHEVRVNGEPKRLTPSEFKLLLLLAEQPERVFSRREIMQHLWDSTYVGDQRACDIHISNLRQKLGSDRIETVRGVGYRVVAV